MRYLYIRTFAIIFAGVFILSCINRTAPEHEDDTARVTGVVVRNVQHVHKVQTSGRLMPYAELKLSFKTGGIIDKISVRNGQDVNRGDKMAVLDLSEIRSHLRQTELQYDKAKRDYERVSNLYDDNAATLEQYQNALTALEIAETARSIAQFNLDHSLIRAPSDGKVLKLFAEENEIIAPGHPVVLFASSREQWLLKVPVTDRSIVDINIGDSADVRFDAYPDEVFKASVAEIAGMADPYTGTFEVSLAIAAGTRRLMTGFIGKASISTARISEYIEIPVEALVEAGGREGIVFRYSDNRAYRERIRIEEILNDRLLVTGNIQAGDTIIREGGAFISHGQKVIMHEP